MSPFRQRHAGVSNHPHFFWEMTMTFEMFVLIGKFVCAMAIGAAVLSLLVPADWTHGDYMPWTYTKRKAAQRWVCKAGVAIKATAVDFINSIA